MKKIAIALILLVASLLLLGCTSNKQANQGGSNEQTQTQNQTNSENNSWKEELKGAIEGIGGTGLPKVAVIKLENNQLSIEYSTWDSSAGESKVFNEQQKIAKVIIDKLKNNQPTTVELTATPSNSYVKETYKTTLSWQNLQKMANLELSQSDWKSKTTSEKIE